MFFTGTVSPQRYEYICKRYGFKNDGSQDNEIITKIHRLFLERIRKETGKSVKHWCVTEKGHTNTRRIHLHGLFYAGEGQTKWQLTKAIRLCLERIRKHTGKSVKHWFITELGHNGTERIHLHGIVWGIGNDKKITEN